MTIAYPLINGHRFSFSSVEMTFGINKFIGVKSLNYKAMLEPAEVRGSRAQALGRTRGKYSCEGSVELYMQEWDELTTVLSAQGVGIYEATFDIKVAYAELPASPIVMDVLAGVRLKGGERALADGSDEAITVKADLSILYIIENGKLPMQARQFLR